MSELTIPGTVDDTPTAEEPTEADQAVIEEQTTSELSEEVTSEETVEQPAPTDLPYYAEIPGEIATQAQIDLQVKYARALEIIHESAKKLHKNVTFLHKRFPHYYDDPELIHFQQYHDRVLNKVSFLPPNILTLVWQARQKANRMIAMRQRAERAARGIEFNSDSIEDRIEEARRVSAEKKEKGIEWP